MPKSRRNKVVPLTVTKKKGRELKSGLIDQVRSNIESFENVYVLKCDNITTAKLQEIRRQWNGSKFCFGKNKVIRVALGKSREDEVADETHKISEKLSGKRGLLFTNQPEEEVLRFFSSFSSPEFAPTGSIAKDTIQLDKGPLTEFPFSLEPRLRQLGLYTSLKKGIVELEKDHIVCKEGEPLTSEASHLLKLMGIEMAEMKFDVESRWSKKSGFKEYKMELSSEVKKSKKGIKTSKKQQKAKKEEKNKKKKKEKKVQDVEMQPQEDEEAEEELEEN